MKPRVGETWRTRYGLKVRLIADDARGPYPLVGLVEWAGEREKAWTFSCDGINCDPCDDGLDLIQRIAGITYRQPNIADWPTAVAQND